VPMELQQRQWHGRKMRFIVGIYKFETKIVLKCCMSDMSTIFR
jgi:hypothetical protein